MNRLRLRIKVRLRIVAPGSLRRLGHRLITHAWLDAHIVEVWRHILWQVIDDHTVQLRGWAARMQLRLPLNKAGGRSARIGTFLQIESLPVTPVAVWIIYVTAADKNPDIPFSAKLDSSPPGKIVCVENVAFIRAFGTGGGAQQIHLTQVAGSRVQPPVRALGESHYLAGAGLQQIGIVILSGNGEDASLIPRPRQ